MQQNMQKAHRFNILATWICAVILTVLSYMQNGISTEFTNTAAVMFSTAALISALYFLPFHGTVKGCSIVCIIGLATLLCSVLQGGSSRNFIASFFVLGLATLYFNSHIILGYGVIYLSACVAAAVVNPAYIDGVNYDRANLLIKLVIYAAVAAVLFVATRKGGRVLHESERASQTIAASAQQMTGVSRKLHSALAVSKGGMDVFANRSVSIACTAEQMMQRQQLTLQTTEALQAVSHTMGEHVTQGRTDMQRLQESFGAAGRCVKQGATQMEQTHSAVAQALDAIEAARQSTTDLLREMESIHKLLDQIGEVASQTNLLAINASIEAARAGSAGKGFAVVASEVRSLASRSAAVADQIQDVVSSLTTAAHSVGHHVDSGADTAEKGMQSLTSLGGVLQELEQTAHTANEIVIQQAANVEQTGAAMEEMRSGITQIVRLAHDDASGVREIASAVQEQNASAEEISTQLQEMTGLSAELSNGIYSNLRK